MSALQAWTMYYITNMELINSSWSGKSDVAELQKRPVALRTLAVAYEAQTCTTTHRKHRQTGKTPYKGLASPLHLFLARFLALVAPDSGSPAGISSSSFYRAHIPATVRPPAHVDDAPTLTTTHPRRRRRTHDVPTTRPRRAHADHDAPTPTTMRPHRPSTHADTVCSHLHGEVGLGKQVQCHITSFFSTTTTIAVAVAASLARSLPHSPPSPRSPPHPIHSPSLPQVLPDLRSTQCTLSRARCAAPSRARVQTAHPRASFLSTTPHHHRPVQHSKVALQTPPLPRTALQSRTPNTTIAAYSTPKSHSKVIYYTVFTWLPPLPPLAPLPIQFIPSPPSPPSPRSPSHPIHSPSLPPRSSQT
ncbi:hypothetical protein B0H14DRAFT_3467115 [Mycena olivaceomarginata]|nr:hypothetical protein B0H14DRAFT_3467115 [Mycena olivaceomarginata]